MSVNGNTYVTDQGIRPGTNLETLSQLKTVFKEDGVITAGNASQISDGAAAVLLMSAEKAKELGLHPRARIIDQTTVGCDPVKMLEGPIPATAKILERNSMSIDDIICSRSTRRSPPSWPPGAASTTPTWTASTSTAARWPSVTRSARPVPASSRRCCTSSSAPTRRWGS